MIKGSDLDAELVTGGVVAAIRLRA